VFYVATARTDPEDVEWVARIAHHAARRPASWSLIETASPRGRDLADVLRTSRASTLLLVDSLGTWLADRMAFQSERSAGIRGAGAALERECEALCDAFAGAPARTIVVTEEVGWSVVPDHPSGRLFRDVLGRMNQRLARESDGAYLVVSGIPLDLHALAKH
ncbi:MAG TPA: bifunctional adenosylcobinamide kinase/adenosylcobinamide-phosphate guanylyltransferase, partial [Candidatus Baltobacteraceae bacterium]